MSKLNVLRAEMSRLELSQEVSRGLSTEELLMSPTTLDAVFLLYLASFMLRTFLPPPYESHQSIH